MYSNEIASQQSAAGSIATTAASLKAKTPGVEGKSSASAANGVTNDQAHISAAGAKMAGQAVAGTAEADVRMEKVAALRLSIQDGSYRVPAGKIADKLIEGMQVK